jgi:wobble nucleotide-excising tRNase
LEFRRYNLIYGWNGSGKTTLSNLFARLAKRESIVEGNVEFEIDGRAVAGTELATVADLPHVRVFNREFVEASVFASTTPLGAIYYFGEANVEKQKELDALKIELAAAETATAKAQENKATAERRLEEFCVQQAKTIKELLTAAGGGGAYNNYNKSDFKQRCGLIGAAPANHLLAEADKTALKQQKDALPKPALTVDVVSYPVLEAARLATEKRLNTTVVSQALDHLVQHPDVAAWVKQGLPLHMGKAKPITCEFCRNEVTPQRLSELEAHFNDEYEKFLTGLDAERDKFLALVKIIKEAKIPSKSELFDHLATGYETAQAELRDADASVIDYLQSLAAALVLKRDKLFEKLALGPLLVGKLSDVDELAREKRAVLDGIIARHNEHGTNLPGAVTAARKKLEAGLAAEAHTEFTKLKTSDADEATRVSAGLAALAALRSRAVELERSLIEHLRPAAELNDELRAFLGRAELSFEALATGYTITRGGQPARDLSEGERTAIAFLYFLKVLQDRAFPLDEGVVVVDDPVSSLDANALFCAFGCLRERTEPAAQLFVLTHSFAFFRQVKNWFHHLPGQGSPKPEKHSARFFMLSAIYGVSGRALVLSRLDRLLEGFESEYHFLFSRVYAEANRPAPAVQLEEYYSLPNLARRLLESFLAFRYPAVQGELMNKLKLIVFSEQKKLRILRFLHTYSHGDQIAEPAHDLTLLAEAPHVLLELLELMKAEDEKHYSAMVALVTPPPAGVAVAAAAGAPLPQAGVGAVVPTVA